MFGLFVPAFTLLLPLPNPRTVVEEIVEVARAWVDWQVVRVVVDALERSTEPATAVAAGIAACEPQQARFGAVSCCGASGVIFWDGVACRRQPLRCGCWCEGRDCGHQFARMSDCVRTYRHCARPP